MSATDLGQPGTRIRADRCPGVLRPWPAHDGGLVRVRVPGGRLTTSALVALAGVAQEYGDGRVRVTGRANLQVRGLPLVDDALPEAVVAAIEATGLLPSRTHDLARNILVSPLTGLLGGRADLRPVTDALDALLLADPALAGLPGRFLFTLDDGRGDLHDRHRDLGLVALDEHTCQLRVGSAWGRVVSLADAPTALVGLSLLFLDRRGTGPSAAWHVEELERPLVRGLDPPSPSGSGYSTNEGPDRRSTSEALVGRVPERSARGRIETLPHGPVAGRPTLTHVGVDEDGIDAETAAAWAALTDEVVITPWHGVLV